MKIKFAFLLQCILLPCTQSARAVNIEMVTVGNAGNAPDMRYNLDQRPEGFGAVNYVYQIGKYEITAGQYTEFLNAVAKDDPNGLYNTAMGSIYVHYYGANIQRWGSAPDFAYYVAADWANRPVNYISFWDAARFCNWLHNDQPTGPQGPGTTEDGAYHDVGNNSLFGRNAGARFFIPTEDEWYKAAYHDKNAGLVAAYFDYPMRTSAVPGNDISETTNVGDNANFYINDLAIGAPYYRTLVGEFEFSDSPYGTFDQGGNVYEWNETKISSMGRGARGGAFNYYDLGLKPIGRGGDDPLKEEYTGGFRVAGVAIPEPTSLALFSIAAMMLGSRSRMRQVQS